MIAKEKLITKLSNALEIEDRNSIFIANVLRRKVIESSVPEKGKPRLIEILDIIARDSSRHAEMISGIIVGLRGRVKDEF